MTEKDVHGDVLWVWSYPAVSRELRDLFIRKSGLSDDTDSNVLQPFICSQFQKWWHYIFTIKTESAALPKVTHVSLVLLTRDFNPEKYECLASILTKLYTKTGNPASMLESYLSVITKGKCNSEDNGMFVVTEYDRRQAFTAACIRDIIAKFGIEVILLVTGMLLKKRIVLYHSSVEELLTVTRSLPAFVWHRQDWAMIYPYVLFGSPEMSEMKSHSHFVAGFRDASVENRPDLYDLFVNLSTNEIVVATHAKDEVFHAVLPLSGQKECLFAVAHHGTSAL
ncbi:hypothetical protein LSH36_486g06053 [Paralvinella palmiformis]|uniref:UDENN domain-containing protein n=1 Tax=Paralvinella palmiformis TaxID=53620 RepID=A0AAD9MX54_9ANNE|nr:hypothetical protein LSH36_486g06053 [Paralvinella palmiformis]